MEVNLIDEDHKIEIINSYKALKYEVKDNGRNIDKIPIYKNWLSMMKEQEGNDGIVCYCTNCHLFFYINSQERYTFHHGECYNDSLAVFYQKCDELYYEESLCCFRSGYKVFEFNYYRGFIDEPPDFLMMIPFFSLFYAFCFIFYIILMIRRKRDNVNYEKEYNIVVRIISGLFYGTYLIAYIILSIPIYFFFRWISI